MFWTSFIHAATTAASCLRFSFPTSGPKWRLLIEKTRALAKASLLRGDGKGNVLSNLGVNQEQGLVQGERTD